VTLFQADVQPGLGTYPGLRRRELEGRRDRDWHYTSDLVPQMMTTEEVSRVYS
jgi:hypothetical protein